MSQTLQFMNPEDILRLCRTKKSFQDICSKYNLFDKVAYDYVKQNALFAEPLARIQDQAAAIKHGQVTPYKYNHSTRTIYMGIGVDFQTGEDIYFEIKGSPATKGTKLWLFAEIPRRADYIQPGLIYSSIEDLKRDMINAANRDYGVMDSFLDTYVDQVQGPDRLNVIDRLIADLTNNGVIDDTILHQITMP